MSRKTVGIALGGGGAKGLAHIQVLKVLDRLGTDVVAISGTSIGAIIGSLYAAGRTGAQVEEIIGEILATPRSLEEAFNSERLFGWIELLGFDLGKSHILEAGCPAADIEPGNKHDESSIFHYNLVMQVSPSRRRR